MRKILYLLFGITLLTLSQSAQAQTFFTKVSRLRKPVAPALSATSAATTSFTKMALPANSTGAPTITTAGALSAGFNSPLIINGTNFDSSTTVTLGGTPPLSFKVVSPNRTPPDRWRRDFRQSGRHEFKRSK